MYTDGFSKVKCFRFYSRQWRIIFSVPDPLGIYTDPYPLCNDPDPSLDSNSGPNPGFFFVFQRLWASTIFPIHIKYRIVFICSPIKCTGDQKVKVFVDRGNNTGIRTDVSLYYLRIFFLLATKKQNITILIWQLNGAKKKKGSDR